MNLESTRETLLSMFKFDKVPVSPFIQIYDIDKYRNKRRSKFSEIILEVTKIV